MGALLSMPPYRNGRELKKLKDEIAIITEFVQSPRIQGTTTLEAAMGQVSTLPPSRCTTHGRSHGFPI